MKSLFAAVVCLVLSAAAAAGAQQPARLQGRVTDLAGRPLAGVNVRAGGAAAGTDEQGSYALPVAPGRITVVASQAGWAVESRTLDVREGEVAQVDFAMRPRAVKIDDGVLLIDDRVPLLDTTEWRAGVRRDTVVPGPARLAAARTLPQLLAGRVPGLQVRPGSGAVASGARLRLRGAPGIDLAGEPLVVVDGVRVASEPNDLVVSLTTGQGPSRLDDFVPDAFERVEVLSAPAAIARYGPRGANGAIEFHTRRGVAGRPRFHGFAEAGARSDAAEYPTIYGRLGRLPNGSETPSCTLARQAAGTCTPVGDSLLAYNAIERASPFRTGGTRRVGASFSGGAGPLVYHAGGTAERDLGVLRRDSRTREEARGSFTLAPGFGVQVSGSALHLRNVLELPNEDASLHGTLANALAGYPFGGDSLRRGLDQLTQAERDSLGVTQDVRRTVATASVRWSPLTWLTVGGQYGIDGVLTGEVPHEHFEGRLPGVETTHVAEADRTRRNADLFARAEYAAPFELHLSTVVGAERWSSRRYAREENRSGDAFSITTQRTRDETKALYVRQGMSWRNRVLASLTLRGDESLAWGHRLLSGALGAAWEVSEEPFFRRAAWMDGLRVRAAYGQAEQHPPELPAAAPQPCPPVGCPFDEKPFTPQRQTEVEGGVDAELLGGWLELSLTAYARRTEGVLALVNGPNFAQIPRSGRVGNRGGEARLRVGSPPAPGLQWELVATGAVNRNRLEELEGAPIILGNPGQFAREGFPVGGFHVRRITGFADRNGDGVIGYAGCTTSDTSACEVQVSQELEFAGSPDPTHVVGLRGRIRLGPVELSALLDHQGGMHRANVTERFRCYSPVQACRASYDPSASLEEQARLVAFALPGYHQVEDAKFTRVREAAVTLSVPGRWARLLGGQGAELTVAGRNLATWTPYSGLDPETNFRGADPLVFGEFFTQPLPRTVTTRLDVRF
jgi:hypothetical protein